MTTTKATNQAHVDRVVAVVMANGPERFSSSVTLSYEIAEEMTTEELRAAIRGAVEQGLIRSRHSSALGVVYYI